MSLFELKDFTMHSGQRSYFKIECDALTDEDLETFAKIISRKYNFKFVRGVPSGGDRLQRKLIKYRNPKSNLFLIVDDVLTTGKSMHDFRKLLEGTYPGYNYKGVVLFARGECPHWIKPIFKMWERP